MPKVSRLTRKVPRSRKSKGYPKGYDSEFEYKLHKNPLKGCSHHSDKVHYSIPRVYTPDFTYESLGLKTLIESKGRFRDSQEASKYIHIRESLDDNEELVFVFYNKDCPMPYAKRRKDGTKQTHAEWAEKNGFRYFTEYSCPKEWKGRKK